jgi:NAD(P)-dependent dehydrogenase (short-subunit alcohol dehydrogenase family)
MELAQRAAAAFGGLDIPVNNTGISYPQPAVEIDPKKFDDTIAVNLRAPRTACIGGRRHHGRAG